MVAAFTIQQLVDFGFMALVLFTCAKTLLGTAGEDTGRREKWRAELKELEASLRQLISEAGAASSTLDRSLLQRKRELEQLLQRLEQRESEAEAKPHKPEPAVHGYNRAKRPVSTQQVSQPPPMPRSELPNDTWTEGEPVFGASSRDQDRSGRAQSSQETPTLKMDMSSLGGWETGMPASQKGLASEVEVLAEGMERETFAQMSIMDPITYKIARRLLASGKEIHVVARKLELPISEIRLLDKLMRKEQGLKESDEGSPVEKSAPPHIVRGAPPQGFTRQGPAKREGEEQIAARDIERGSALL